MVCAVGAGELCEDVSCGCCGSGVGNSSAAYPIIAMVLYVVGMSDL